MKELCLGVALNVDLVQVKAGDRVITQAWARATPKGAKTGGGYLTIENNGTAPDRLIGGSADIAGSVEVHWPAILGKMSLRVLTISPRVIKRSAGVPSCAWLQVTVRAGAPPVPP